MRRAFLICLALATPVLAAAAVPPEPEQFVDMGRYSDYADQAQAYLQSNADSPSAPRVAMDLLEAATVFDDQPVAAKMRDLVVVGYPESLQAKYLVGQLADAAQFASLLGEAAAENLDHMPPDFPRRYVQALRLGLARFGQSAMGEAPNLTLTAFLARMAGDGQIAAGAIQLLNQTGARGDVWRQILLIIADDSATPLARLIRLHAIADHAAAAPFEQYMLNQLSAADRQSQQAVRIEADDCLDSGRLSDALILLAKLPVEPRTLFWQGCASAAGENYVGAEQDFDRLIQQYPGDPWAKEAGQLSPAIAGFQTTLDRDVEAALTATRGLKKGTDLLEAQLEFDRPGGRKIDAYIGIQSGKLLEMLFKEGGETAVAYRATDQDASLYFQGQKTLSHYAKPALLPVPLFTLAREGDGFFFRANLKFSYSFDELETALSNLTASDFLNSREGLQDFLRSFARRGIFPLPPAAGADGSTVYSWMWPAVMTPTLSHVSFTVNSSGAITDVQGDDFSVSGLRYGPAGAFALSPPALPDLPNTESGQMGISVLQRELAGVLLLFNPPPPSTQATTKP